MSSFYKTINSVLSIIALLVSLWMLKILGGSGGRSDVPAPEQVTAQDAAGGSANESTGNAVKWQDTTSAARLIEERSHVLWGGNLFNPTRTEGVDIESGEASTTTFGAKMELVGIGAIDGKSAAVIIIHGAPGRRGRSDRKRTRHVYTPGDMIDGTGYVLEKVSLHEAILTKGADERVLRFETTDPASQKRSDEAAQEIRTVKPSPTADTPSKIEGGESSEDRSSEGADIQKKENDRRERLKKALDERRKILEQRRRNSQK